MPSLVEVTNLENGRSLRLRVNDRGPFHGDREIDLSQAAARELGFENKGLAKVRVRFVGLLPANGTPPSTRHAAPDRTQSLLRRLRPHSKRASRRQIAFLPRASPMAAAMSIHTSCRSQPYAKNRARVVSLPSSARSAMSSWQRRRNSSRGCGLGLIQADGTPLASSRRFAGSVTTTPWS